MESGSGELTPLADHRKAFKNVSSESSFVRLTREVGCPTPHASIQCMRLRDAKQLRDTIVEHNLYFGSTFDGNHTTVKDPAAVRRAKLAAPVPVLMGTNADETSTFVEADVDEFHQSLYSYAASVFGNRKIRDGVREKYAVGPGMPYATDRQAIAALETAYAYTCLTSREATISAESGYPTWRYYFNFSSPNTMRFPGSGAYHGSEIRFVFGNLAQPTGKLSAEELKVSESMQKVWADFAKDPSKGPGWPKVGSAEKDVGYFGAEGLKVVSKNETDRNCDMFKRMYIGRA
jgi:carboxylesterase type B